jgi:hypothetical protein
MSTDLLRVVTTSHPASETPKIPLTGTQQGLSSEVIQKLPETYSKGNLKYKMAWRNAEVAIYEVFFERKRKSDVEPTRHLLGYEVICIKLKGKSHLRGGTLPRREAIPAPEEWGKLGWYYQIEADAYNKALAKFNELARKYEQGGLHE